jgi:hypothetical protein
MPSTSRTRLPWWHRRTPSIAVLALVLGALTIIVISLSGSVRGMLPEVGRDRLGEDPWTDPIGLENVDGFQIAHVPDCALTPVTKIVLWDENSKAYWQVSGPPTLMPTFSVGATPDGFHVDQAYTKPPPGAVLWLVAFRSIGGAAGIRYQRADLVTHRVVSGRPLSRFTIDGYQSAKVCKKKGSKTNGGGSAASTTTTPVVTSVPG